MILALPRPRLFAATSLIVALAFLALSQSSWGAPAAKSKGKVVSAKLTANSFPASQARTMKLVCKFSTANHKAVYLLQAKTEWGWVKVRSVTKPRARGQLKMTVKTLFGSKTIRQGQYRIKITSDSNSIARRFAVVAEPTEDDEECDPEVEDCEEDDFYDPEEDPDYGDEEE